MSSGGGGWKEMEDHLRQLASTLVKEGWSVFDTARETTDEDGDLVCLVLYRDGTAISLELEEDGDVVLWFHDDKDADVDDWEPAVLLTSVVDATVDSCRAAFIEVGWLRPTG